METVNIHEAKTHLSRLIQKAVEEEPFVAGKPMVTVMAYEKQAEQRHREMGFLKGKYTVPDDVKSFAREDIEEMFTATQIS